MAMELQILDSISEHYKLIIIVFVIIAGLFKIFKDSLGKLESEQVYSLTGDFLKKIFYLSFIITILGFTFLLIDKGMEFYKEYQQNSSRVEIKEQKRQLELMNQEKIAMEKRLILQREEQEKIRLALLKNQQLQQKQAKEEESILRQNIRREPELDPKVKKAEELARQRKAEEQLELDAKVRKAAELARIRRAEELEKKGREENNNLTQYQKENEEDIIEKIQKGFKTLDDIKSDFYNSRNSLNRAKNLNSFHQKYVSIKKYYNNKKHNISEEYDVFALERELNAYANKRLEMQQQINN